MTLGYCLVLGLSNLRNFAFQINREPTLTRGNETKDMDNN